MDHHVCLNWGNWHAAAGLKRRIFSRTKGTLTISNIAWEFQKHDPKGLYVRHWIPGLRCVPDKFSHEPWNWPRRDTLKTSPDGYFVCDALGASAATRSTFSPQSRMQLKRSIDVCLGQSQAKSDCVKACKTRAQHKAAMEQHSSNARLLSVSRKVDTVHVKGFVTVNTSAAMSTAMPIWRNASSAVFDSTSAPQDTRAISSKTTAMAATTYIPLATRVHTNVLHTDTTATTSTMVNTPIVTLTAHETTSITDWLSQGTCGMSSRPTCVNFAC